MNPHVVDANVMNSFQRERLHEDDTVASEAIAHATTDNYIVLDEGGQCQQEWLDCAGGSYPLHLQDWLADMMVTQQIRLARLCADSMHKELNNLGIPKKDHKWVRLAIGSSSNIILTDDIDLFDPTKKNSSSSNIANIKAKCAGPVSKYLKKRHGICVATPTWFVRNKGNEEAVDT